MQAQAEPTFSNADGATYKSFRGSMSMTPSCSGRMNGCMDATNRAGLSCVFCGFKNQEKEKGTLIKFPFISIWTNFVLSPSMADIRRTPDTRGESVTSQIAPGRGLVGHRHRPTARCLGGVWQGAGPMRTVVLSSQRGGKVE
jgi:hypothetical protein